MSDDLTHLCLSGKAFSVFQFPCKRPKSCVIRSITKHRLHVDRWQCATVILIQNLVSSVFNCLMFCRNMLWCYKNACFSNTIHGFVSRSGFPFCFFSPSCLMSNCTSPKSYPNFNLYKMCKKKCVARRESSKHANGVCLCSIIVGWYLSWFGGRRAHTDTSVLVIKFTGWLYFMVTVSHRQ